MSKSTLILSYTLTAVLGWGGATLLNQRDQDSASAAPTNQPGRAKAKDRDVPIDGGQLIDDLQQSLDDSSGDSVRPVQEQVDAFIADYERMKAELAPTGAPQQTFRDLFARLAPALENGALLNDDSATPELAVRYHQWMLEDPAAALRFLSEAGPNKPGPILGELTSRYLKHLGKDFVAEKGFAHSLAVLGSLPKDRAWIIKQHVVTDLAQRGSIEDFIRLEETSPQPATDRDRASLGRQIGDAWPADRSAELLSHLQGRTAGAAAIALADRMEDSNGLQWVLDLVTSGALDSSATKYLSDRSVANQLVDREGVSIDERVAAYETLGIMKGRSDHFVGAMIIDWELREFMFNKDDWHFAFRHGEASANDVLDAAMKTMPDFASRRGEVASQLFRQLAEDNPDAAVELIAGQSDSNIAWARTNSTRWAFFSVNPNDVHNWIEGTASLDDPKQDAAFAEGWRGRSGSNLHRFGGEYVQWAGNLPAGPQRKMVLEGIIANSKTSNPDLAERAGNLLKNEP